MGSTVKYLGHVTFWLALVFIATFVVHGFDATTVDAFHMTAVMALIRTLEPDAPGGGA